MTAGQDPQTFWTVTPREAGIILAGAAARDLHQRRHQQGLVYTMAVLASFAANDPKKMPKFDKVFPDAAPKKAQTPEEMLAAMREWVAVMATAQGDR